MRIEGRIEGRAGLGIFSGIVGSGNVVGGSAGFVAASPGAREETLEKVSKGRARLGLFRLCRGPATGSLSVACVPGYLEESVPSAGACWRSRSVRMWTCER